MTGTYASTGHKEECPEIDGPACAQHPVPPEWHDLRLYFGELRLHADYGITSWLAADLAFAVRMVAVRYQLRDFASMQPIDPPYGEDIHHRSETIIGPTDPWLSLRASVEAARWSFRFRAGATLPLGSTVQNPFALARAGRVHQHLQLGTGTVNPFAEVEVQRAAEHWSVGVWLLGKAPLYDNGHGYRAGSQLLGGVRVGSDLWLSRWRFALGLLAYHEEAERWSGVVEDEGNLGRTDLIVEGSVTWRFAEPWSVTLGLRAPVQSWAVGAQLNTPAIGELTVARPFELLGGR